ncbi:GATOR2 complex protein WDR24 [Lepeophtheirus salmonis]|uniref:GATOR2 complex protein WDR24 n=1 Tax=Lepeophtheirus salmonis TaxID=72036 RepID=UPI001AE46702|nr:GATOR complex protein WDR24-like [Lepeophtheirus salmonis]XP_040581284.1 GATOR complex protein WDR24-like [Lepeophtheirus salmonis]
MAMFQVSNDGPVYSLDLNSDNDAVVIAGKSLIKVYNLDNDVGFIEKINLKPSKNICLNYSCIDVAWSRNDENLIASAAANGAIVLWNLGKVGRSKQEHVFQEHKRTVNKVTFHPSEPSWLLSGSHEGIVKLFDIRSLESISQFFSNTEGVRDVQFNPHNTHQFASVSDNGRVQLWDLRKTDKCEKQWPAHDGYVFGCDWHPEIRNTLATAGRDKSIKIWDTGPAKATCDYFIGTIGPVGKVKWRPKSKNQLASSALSPIDFTINVWDVRRPYLPYATFDYHKDTTTSIIWKNTDPNFILSSSKDGFLCLHNFNTANKPAERANPVGICINTYGDITHAFPHKKKQSKLSLTSVFPSTSQTSIGVNGSKMGGLFKKSSQSLGGDDFVAPESKLRTYQNKVSNESPLEITGMNYFLTSAEKYLLSGDSLDKLCDHNSSVAQSLNRFHVAQTWLSLKILFKCNLFDEKDTNLRSQDDVGTDEPETDTDKPPLNETRTRHYSSGSSFQNSRSSGNPLGLSNLSNTNQVCSRTGSGNERFNSGGYNNNYNNSEEESDSDDDNEDSYEKTLSNIASGQKLSGDFFGDSEFSSLCVDQLIAVDNSYKSDMIDWTLPCEAFDPRHDMKASTNHAESEEYLQQHGEESSGVDDNVHSVAVPESNNDSLEYLKVDTLSLFPVWSPKPIVKDTLVFYAERGDVQTVVSIYLVLGHDRIGGLIQDSILENWFSAYIDLLHQFQMYNKATEIINLCSFQPGIYQMSQLSTTYFINCTNCSKALNRNPMWCNRCQTFPNQCAVCHRVVKGLFVWCQGCGHGGHIEHLSEWLEKNTLCPTGCGHHCEYH